MDQWPDLYGDGLRQPNVRTLSLDIVSTFSQLPHRGIRLWSTKMIVMTSCNTESLVRSVWRWTAGPLAFSTFYCLPLEIHKPYMVDCHGCYDLVSKMNIWSKSYAASLVRVSSQVSSSRLVWLAMLRALDQSSSGSISLRQIVAVMYIHFTMKQGGWSGQVERGGSKPHCCLFVSFSLFFVFR